MGNIQRDAVPDWARSAPTQEQTLSGERKISPAQRKYLLDLIGRKNTPKAEASGKIDQIMKCLRISEDPEEFGMSSKKASELIDWFNKQPDKPKAHTTPDVLNAIGDSLPAGRYALSKTGSDDPNELRFYQVWESRDKQAKRIYVLHGPDSSRLPLPAQMDIAGRILKEGVRECTIRYGMEIRECSNCGRRLTNRISRELGIGPICGGRMFGEGEWKDEVKTKRQEIMARGENPDEELE